MNVRWIVLKILDTMEFEDLFVHEAMERYMGQEELSKQDRAFIKKVVFGTIEQRLYLDHVINQFSQVKINKMKPAIRHTLRMSVYQMLFMDKIPVSAIINEAVKLIKKRKMYRLTGFVNGVLRAIDRGRDQIKMPNPSTQRESYLSIKYGYNLETLRLLEADLGQAALERFLEVSNEEAPLTIRTNEKNTNKEALIAKLGQAGLECEATGLLEEAYYLKNVDYLGGAPGFVEGDFTVQDESSMLVGRVAAKERDVEQVLDLCAAPGGKTTHMADLLPKGTAIHAFDVSPAKVQMIEENIMRQRISNVDTAVADARDFLPKYEGVADIVVTDVPCSGLGIIRKKPDIKINFDPRGHDDLCQLQRTILENGARYVKPGGILLFSTCTILKKENQDQVEWFLEQHPDFSLEPIELWPELAKDGMISLLPISGGMDGFFIARLRKKDL